MLGPWLRCKLVLFGFGFHLFCLPGFFIILVEGRKAETLSGQPSQQASELWIGKTGYMAQKRNSVWLVALDGIVCFGKLSFWFASQRRYPEGVSNISVCLD